MKRRGIRAVVLVMLFLGCTKHAETVAEKEGKRATQTAKKVQEIVDYSYYTISQEDLRNITEANEITNAVSTLTVSDVDGLVPDPRYFSRFENLNILTKSSVEHVVLGEYPLPTCKRVFINDGIADGDAEKVKYGSIKVLELRSGLQNVEYMKVFDSDVEQIIVKDELPKLEELQIKGTSNISDTTFLAKLPNLKKLQIYVSRTAPTVLNVSGNPKLKGIDVSGNITSLEGLKVCNLDWIALSEVPAINTIVKQIPESVEYVYIISCDITIAIVDLLPQKTSVALAGNTIIYRDEDVKDYGDKEISVIGDKAVQFFRKYIKKDDDLFMKNYQESFKVGQTEYVIQRL